MILRFEESYFDPLRRLRLLRPFGVIDKQTHYRWTASGTWLVMNEEIVLGRIGT